MKKLFAFLLLFVLILAFSVSFAEMGNSRYQYTSEDGLVAGISVDPPIVKTPQQVSVSISIQNNADVLRTVQLYSPAAEAIGNSYEINPGQTVFVSCNFNVNQRMVDKGTLTYFIKYNIFNEYGKEVEHSSTIRYSLSGNVPQPKAPTQNSDWPSLTAAEVMYNYSNSYQKDFYLKGVGELRNYYNYAYDDCEKDYFCMRVTPSDRPFDTWYIYFHRESFKELFDDAIRSGKVSLEMKCNVTRYTDGQRDMAEALRVRWGK